MVEADAAGPSWGSPAPAVQGSESQDGWPSQSHWPSENAPAQPAFGPEGQRQGGHPAYPDPSQQGPTGHDGPGQQGPAGHYGPGPQGPAGYYGSGQNGSGPSHFGPGPYGQAGPGHPGPYGQPPQGTWFQNQPPAGPPPGGNAGWNVPVRRRKTLDELKALALKTRERSRLFVLMVIGMLIVVQLDLPFRLAGIPLGLAAGYVGIRAMVGLAEMRRAGMGSRGIILTMFGLGLTGYLLIVLMSHAVYYPVWSELERCEARANTDVAMQTCQDDSRKEFDRILDNLQDRTRNP